ncbi:MAG: hypothetical protein FJY97_05105 [candidate division Zixibacteria bacterium]|nr:hypothetical protein [candidate division Zixibacteria bacterium]
MTSRLELLKMMAEKEPGEPFLIYAIALEYAGTGQLEEAAETLERLMTQTPDYPPGFHQAGRVYEQLDRTEDARRCYTLGIAVAERAGDAHARAEMAQALMMLE